MGRLNWNRWRRVHTPWYDQPGIDKIVDKLLALPDPTPTPKTKKAWKAKRKPQRVQAAYDEFGGGVEALLVSTELLEAAVELLDVRSCIAHTDGGCEPNPGQGGWGVSIEVGGQVIKEMSGSHATTTNNRMEMTAALVALSILPATCSVTIISDSQYLIKGATDWMDGWKRNGFRRGDGFIPNVDLWRAIDALTSDRVISWMWVRGHSGHAGNERADQLAAAAIKSSRNLGS